MTRDKDRSASAESGSETNEMLVVFKTIGDTTWRMFVPVIVGALLGFWFGGNQGAIIGSIVGLLVAGLLVWQQYTQVTKGGGK